jgi:hypothetical protein
MNPPRELHLHPIIFVHNNPYLTLDIWGNVCSNSQCRTGLLPTAFEAWLHLVLPHASAANLKPDEQI